MKSYQRLKTNNLRLEHTVYNRVITFVRDFERIKKEYDEIILRLGGYSLEGGGVSSGKPSSPTEAAAMKRIAKWKEEIDSLNKALSFVPREYREAVVSKCLYDRYGTKQMYYASERTLARWKAVFVYALAVELGFIE